MPRFSDEFIEQIRDRNSIDSVISDYVELKRRGRTLVGLCPFHNEKTPSFTVYPETNSYYCFGCGTGGEVINFVRSIENLDFLDAVKFLADRAGLKLPDDYDDSGSKLRRRIYEANREAARFYHETLFTERGKEQLQYLLNRGLTKKTIVHFGLGAAPDDWRALGDYLISKGFHRDELVSANLLRMSEKDGKRYYYDAFRNKVMYPIIDLRGNVIAFGGRVLDNSKPKYINTSDTPVYKKSTELFALNFAKNGNDRKIILCEGYMDVIALHQAGFTNAVAGLGTALTPEQVSLISRYADEVSLCYDSDEAGQKALNAAIRLFSKTGVNIKVIKISGGKDPDEIIKNHGKEAFAKLLNAANNDIEYKLSVLKQKYDIVTDDGKVKYLTEAAKVLAFCSPLEKDIYALRLSEELGVGKEAIFEQIKRFATSASYTRRRNEFSEAQKQAKSLEIAADPQRVKNMRAAKAEDTILISLFNNASFYKELKDRLSEELFITPVNKRIFKVICTRLETDADIDISHLSQSLTSEEVSAVAKLLANQAMISNTVAECEDCIKVLEDEKRKREELNPDEMSDDSFLAYFSSLNKEQSE
ncbi:MAG: DNA primase [Acutalibacteraceae bacterium]